MQPNPDPARVFGYITLVDPNTGQKHRPLGGAGADGIPGPIGQPVTITVFFRVIETGAIAGVGLTAATGSQGLRDGHDAIEYDFELKQIRGLAGSPALSFSAFHAETTFFGSTYCVISYDPDRFRFDHVAMGNYRFTDPTGVVTEIPLVAATVPFADLPDFSAVRP